MALGLDPKLPLTITADWSRRITRRLTDLLREWAAVLNPWIGPSWEDLRFPAQGINPLGAPSPAALDNSTYPGTLLFSGSAENHIAGVAQMPHSWLEGTAIRPHIHWSKTVADPSALGVTWQFCYAVSPIGGKTEAYSSWTAGTLAVGSLTEAERHNITSFGEVPLTGYLGSTIVLWRVRRLGNTDDYGQNARLLEFDFHYRIGQVGSSNKQEYPSLGAVAIGVACGSVVVTLAGGTAAIAQPLQVTATAGGLVIVAGSATIVGSPVTITATPATVVLTGVGFDWWQGGIV